MSLVDIQVVSIFEGLTADHVLERHWCQLAIVATCLSAERIVSSGLAFFFGPGQVKAEVILFTFFSVVR